MYGFQLEAADLRNCLEEGIYLDGEEMIWAWDGQKKSVCSVRELNLIGRPAYSDSLSYPPPMSNVGHSIA